MTITSSRRFTEINSASFFSGRNYTPHSHEWSIVFFMFHRVRILSSCSRDTSLDNKLNCLQMDSTGSDLYEIMSSFCMFADMLGSSFCGENTETGLAANSDG